MLGQCTTSPELGLHFEHDRGLLRDHLPGLDQQEHAWLGIQKVQSESPVRLLTEFWSRERTGLSSLSLDSSDSALQIQKSFSDLISDSKPVSKATKPQVHLQLNYSQTSSGAMCSQIRVLLQDT